VTGPLNLASRPFRNETLPSLLFGIAALALLGATVQHGVVLRRLLSPQVSALKQESAQLEAESERLRARGRELAVVRPDKESLARWALVKGLVDRRLFSWTDLLGRLAQVVPRGVRLTSLAPEPREGSVRINISAAAQSAEDGIAFVRSLEEREEFSAVYLLRASEREEGAEFQYVMDFRPPPPGSQPTVQEPAEADEPTDEEPLAPEIEPGEGEVQEDEAVSGGPR
jgi:Tfp pilus assembly protein PilN